MSRERFHQLLAQFKERGFVPRVAVLYHGGEPLLSKDLEYFISMLKKDGVKKTVITTNASLLTEERARGLIGAGLDEMKVSFDGESPEENNRIRRNADFKKDSANVKNFLRIKKELGVGNPVVKISNVRICTKEMLDKLHKEGRFEFGSLPEYLLDAFRGELNDFECQSHPAMVWPGIKDGGGLEVIRYERETSGYCALLFETISILADGSVVACCLDLAGEIIFGNVFETNIFDIWENEKFTAFRNNFRKRKYANMCLNCFELVPRYLVKKER